MSNDVQPIAWKTKLGNSPAKTVLVMLAEVANSAGFGFPSVPTVCDRTELSERQVLRVLQCFQQIGLIVKTKGIEGRYKYGFQITMSMLGMDLRKEFHDAFMKAQGKSVSETVNGPVSETPKTVSETLFTVSETVPPHPLYGGTVNEPSLNHPPTPASGGCEGLNPVLLAEAIDLVMRGCDVSNRRKRPLIRAALEQAGRSGESVIETANRIVHAWKEQANCNGRGLLRGAYGFDKFIGNGIWADDGTWLWDQKELRNYQNARVGSC